MTGDPIRWQILSSVQALRLPDCWIGAGFVRDAVWDSLHGRSPSSPIGDIDVIWFNLDTDADTDRQLEAKLSMMQPELRWSVKNQARMHIRNGDIPYKSTEDAMRWWPETATVVAVRRHDDDRCEIIAPYGLGDLFELVITPTPAFAVKKYKVVKDRMVEKDWLVRYPLLRVLPYREIETETKVRQQKVKPYGRGLER